MQTTNPSWLVFKAPADLKGQIRFAVQKGYHVMSQTETTAQLLREKHFSCLVAFLGLLCFFVGFLLYVIYYLAQRNDKIYLDIETQPTKEEIERLIEKEKNKPWWQKDLKQKALILALLFAIWMIWIIANQSNPSAPPVVVNSTSTTQEVKRVFDVPSLLGKNIDQVKKVLGEAVDGSEPTAQQMRGTTEWSNSWKKEGVELLVTYDAKTRKIIDFFIIGSGSLGSVADKTRLLSIGGLTSDGGSYTTEFVKMRKDPTQFTGVKIVPKPR